VGGKTLFPITLILPQAWRATHGSSRERGLSQQENGTPISRPIPRSRDRARPLLASWYGVTGRRKTLLDAVARVYWALSAVALVGFGMAVGGGVRRRLVGLVAPSVLAGSFCCWWTGACCIRRICRPERIHFKYRRYLVFLALMQYIEKS
jgi:hypothetical protein